MYANDFVTGLQKGKPATPQRTFSRNGFICRIGGRVPEMTAADKEKECSKDLKRTKQKGVNTVSKPTLEVFT